MPAEIARLPVLVVDDDEPTQRLLQAVLRRAGFASEVASNGRVAMQLLENGEFAAIVLDVMMPNVDGREVVQFLLTKETPAPVIICSAASPKILQDFDPRVVKAVLRKPFDVDELLSMIISVARA
jgi:CheY-like chemotaxis protein